MNLSAGSITTATDNVYYLTVDNSCNPCIIVLTKKEYAIMLIKEQPFF